MFAWLVTIAAVAGALQLQAPGAAKLSALGREVIDAGYRSDVVTLERAIADLQPLIRNAAGGSRAAYFSGFGRLQLALITGGADAPADPRHLDAAIQDLQIAVNLDASDPEAALLLGHCFGLKRSSDPRGDPAVQLQANALRARAAALAPANPRVVLIDAMGLYYRPPQAGGNREHGLARWDEALALFAKAAGKDGDLGWGHAEAYWWLAQLQFNADAPDQARALLEKALAIRPDFAAVRRTLDGMRRK
jgi:tetratricopeptide (TPR) repeat protein